MFLSHDFSPDVCSILTKLTTYKNQLPQGTPTSTHIANLVFMPFDNKLIIFCEKNEITYTRFVDDLSFSSSKNFKEKQKDILKIIKSSGFKINNQKTFFKIGPTPITGIITKNNVLSARENQKQKLNDPTLNEKQISGLKNYINRVESF